LLDKLSDIPDKKQKENKIKNLLSEMSKNNKTIKNKGTRTRPEWVLT